jgi:hypothetical protein
MADEITFRGAKPFFVVSKAARFLINLTRLSVQGRRQSLFLLVPPHTRSDWEYFGNSRKLPSVQTVKG